MPDLISQVFYHCQSAENWQAEVVGSKGDKYTVRWDRHSHKNHNVEYDYSCTCMAYKTRSGYCKHINEVKSKHCNWTQFIDGGEVVRKDGQYECPHCGAHAEAMRWAV